MTIALVAAFAVTGVAGLEAYRNAAEFVYTNRIVNHTHEVLVSISKVMGSARDLQSDLRSYVLIGDEKFLDAYFKSRQRAQVDLDALEALTSDNSHQTARVGEIRKLITTRIEYDDEVMKALRTEGYEAARKIIASGRGAAITDQIRKVVVSMEDEETGLLKTRSDLSNVSEANLRLKFIFLTALGLMVIGATFSIVNRDAGARSFAEQALRENEEQLQSMLDNTSWVISMRDPDGRFQMINRQFEKTFGLSREKARDMTVAELFPGQAESIDIHDRMAIERGGPVEYEERTPLPDGMHTWSVTKFPICNPDGSLRALCAMSVDITDRKKAEEQNLLLNSQLAATNKELEAFSYSVSHDLRAPLRSIDGFSQALVEDYAGKLDSEARDYLDRIRAGVGRMAQLIDDLLDLARVGRTEMNVARVDASAMANAVVADIRGREPNRQAEILVQNDLSAFADARLLRVVLENLVGNAWKFSSQRERARIELGQEHLPDGTPYFFVKDNGAGFDMAYAGKLFGIFQRLHAMNEFEGTGIGLATVQRIVHRHGGKIWAEGAVGRGAKISFTFPPLGDDRGSEPPESHSATA